MIQQQGQRATELEGKVHHWLEETKKYTAQAQQSEGLRAKLNEVQAELEQQRNKSEASAKEKLDLLGQLEKIRLDLTAAAADRTRMSADIAKLADQVTRQQAELEERQKTNESLTGELQEAREESRNLTALLDARSRALEGAINSLEAARARIHELQTHLSEIEEHRLVRVLKACRLWPW